MTNSSPPISFSLPFTPTPPANPATAQQSSAAAAPPQPPHTTRQSPPVSPGSSGMRHRLHQQLPQADAQAKRLADMLGMEREELDTQLPALQWCKQSGAYALRDEDGVSRSLSLPGLGSVTEVDAALVKNENDSSPAAVAARELHRLMTDFAPRHVLDLLLAKTAPVWIDREIFHLPVSVTGTHTAEMHFTGGGVLRLVRASAAVPYIPTAGTPSRQASPAPGQPAVQSSAEMEKGSGVGFSPWDIWEDDPLPPLFGLDADLDHDVAQLIELDADLDRDVAQPIELDADLDRDVAQPIDFTPDADAQPYGATGKRRASGPPQADENDALPRQKRPYLGENAFAGERWAAYCATRKIRLPSWDELDKSQQLLLQAAAASLPVKEEYDVYWQKTKRAGVLVTGKAIVQMHRDQRFAALAGGIATITGRYYGSINALQMHIKDLGEKAFRDVLLSMLDEIKDNPNPAQQGDKPLKEDPAVWKIRGALLFLTKVEKVQGREQTGMALLKTMMDEILTRLPEDKRTAPDPETSADCVRHLAERLGMPNVSVRIAKPAIKKLTGVDLAFHNAGNTRATAPVRDHPIPATGGGAALRDRFDKLPSAKEAALKGGWSVNQAAFLGFLEKRNEIRNASDPRNNVYADSITAAMWLMEKLEKRPSADGALQEVEPWLKGVFEKALGKPVTDWSALGTLAPKEKQIVSQTLQNDLKIESGSANRLFPLILHLTGISLWSREIAPPRR